MDAETGAGVAARKNADLPVRIVSALVMIALSVGALVAGEPWFGWFVLAVVLATLVEFVLLVVKATPNISYRLAGILAGTIYIGVAGYMLSRFPLPIVVGVIGAVIFVDSFAYLFGRTLGGPKIAPAISPSKTWAGLLGGIVGATVWIAGWIYVVARSVAGETTMFFDLSEAGQILGLGAAVAVVAQAGDFLQSWLKRKADPRSWRRIRPDGRDDPRRAAGRCPARGGTLMRSISILGATGSVGEQTLDLVRRNPAEWNVVALTANSNVAALAATAREFGAQVAVVADESRLGELRDALAGSGIEAAAGRGALCEAASRPVDMTVAAIVGCAGLGPVMAAIEQGGTIALANKEALVSAGEVMTAAVARHGATLLPVDSEHNAIFQCLAGGRIEDVRSITLTASGGPLRTVDDLSAVTPEQAIAHPNWDMGAKISVDSATMFNKGLDQFEGLELIEAHHLFPVGLNRIRIVVHPQSVIHSMVEYRDGSTLAQLGPSDMRVPIASCLAWPARMDTPMAPLDLPAIGEMSFFAPDETRFPATRLAREAAEVGGAAPAVLNAANEIAVAAFLDRKIAFSRIAVVVEDVLNQGELPEAPRTLEDVLRVDEDARSRATRILEPA